MRVLHRKADTKHVKSLLASLAIVVILSYSFLISPIRMEAGLPCMMLEIWLCGSTGPSERPPLPIGLISVIIRQCTVSTGSMKARNLYADQAYPVSQGMLFYMEPGLQMRMKSAPEASYHKHGAV